MKWARRLAFPLFMTLAQSSAAQLSMSGVFGDHMVMQRDRPMSFYGRAPAGVTVTVQAGAAQGSTRANSDGRWLLNLSQPPPAGASFEISVSTPQQNLHFSDVVAGEVWLVSGQSNMEWPIAFLPEGKQEVAAAGNPRLRLLQVGKQRLSGPSDELSGSWQPATPDSVAMFSAIGYYFGRDLQGELQVPVGIIEAAWGGSRIEPWIPRSAWLQAQRAGKLKVTDMGGGLSWLGTMYNGMVHALTGFGIRGVLWYQGESNVRDGDRYLPKMQTLIDSWRQAWARPQLPFYFAQLAPFDEQFGGMQLPPMWAVQTQVLDSVPYTEMVATQDLNPELAIHPIHKRQVAERFLRLALAQQYGRPALCQSPRLAALQAAGDSLKLRLTNAQGLQVRNDGAALGFEVAGRDGVYQPARAEISGEQIILRSALVPAPVTARYAWDFELAAMANVVNAAGLPLLPFRSAP